jgi:hypothetical protein
LPADIDRVFTTNTLSYFTRDEAVRRRLHFINISKSIILLSSTSSSDTDDNTSPDADAARVGGIKAMEGDNSLSKSFPAELFSPLSKQTEPAGMYVKNLEFQRKLAEPVLFRPFVDTPSNSVDPIPPDSSSSISTETQLLSPSVSPETTSSLVLDSAGTQSTAGLASPDPINDQTSPLAPKKRGRPKGSKNKKK